jgi:hypothetical protein
MRPWRRLPQPVRFLSSHVAIGYGIAAIFVGGLLLADPTRAGTVLLTAADHWWPAAALWGLTGLTFGAAQFGVATMLLGKDGGRPHTGSIAPVAVPVPVRARRH